MTITLPGSSPFNAILREMKERSKVGVSIESRLAGEVLVDTSGWFEETSPRHVGRDESLWELKVMG